MNDKRIGIGIATWFLGMIVPVYHHVGLHSALINDRTSNIIARIHDVFEWLPWIDWVYLALMTLVGGVLIVSGALNRPVESAG